MFLNPLGHAMWICVAKTDQRGTGLISLYQVYVQLIVVQIIKLEKEYLRTAAASGDDMHKPCQKVFIVQ
jgi:hypothetical protein